MLIDFGSRAIQIKIVYYGPAMSGKTTALNYLFKKFNSQLTSINTSHKENNRTLFYDFGFIVMNIGKWDLKINLWSATGQDFYCVTRSTVLQGSDGIIFVADSKKELINDNIKSFNELKTFFPDKLERNIALVVCLNKRDVKDGILLDSFKNNMDFLSNTKIFETIAYKEGYNIQESFKHMFNKILELHGDIYQTLQEEINFA